MNLEQLEQEARFVARNADHNLNLIRKNPHMVRMDKLIPNIAYLEMMSKLNKADLEAQKNARPARRTLSLRSHLKSLLLFILADDQRESKGETV